jgi:hypothetical protein
LRVQIEKWLYGIAFLTNHPLGDEKHQHYGNEIFHSQK